MHYALRTCTVADAQAVSKLVHRTFAEFVAPEWELSACETFGTETSPDKFCNILSEATFASVAAVEQQIVGIIVLPKPNLLSLLFVHRDWHKQGVARALWQAARTHLETHNPDVKTVELNSTPYALPAYRSLGFYPISEQFKRSGSVATRMACWLPGRALALAK
jgi:GNAT superfamily N-acetyltransferase